MLGLCGTVLNSKGEAINLYSNNLYMCCSLNFLKSIGTGNYNLLHPSFNWLLFHFFRSRYLSYILCGFMSKFFNNPFRINQLCFICLETFYGKIVPLVRLKISN